MNSSADESVFILESQDCAHTTHIGKLFYTVIRRGEQCEVSLKELNLGYCKMRESIGDLCYSKYFRYVA